MLRSLRWKIDFVLETSAPSTQRLAISSATNVIAVGHYGMGGANAIQIQTGEVIWSNNTATGITSLTFGERSELLVVPLYLFSLPMFILRFIDEHGI